MDVKILNLPIGSDPCVKENECFVINITRRDVRLMNASILRIKRKQ